MKRSLVERALYAALVVAGAVMVAAVLWAWGLPMTNDGPAHVFAAWIHNHYDDPALHYKDFYDLTSPVTSRGFFEVQLVLEPLFGWQTAWRINVVIGCELWAFSFLAFVCALSPARKWTALLAFPFSLQTALWIGLMPFIYASALGWLALALWCWRPPKLGAHVLLAGLLYVQARIHVEPAAATGVLLLVVTAVRERGRERWTSLLGLALAGLPSLVVALLSLEKATAELGAMDINYFDFADRLLNAGNWFQAGPKWRPAGAMLLAFAGVGATAYAQRTRGAPRVELALAVVSFAILFASPSVPEDFGGWQLAGLRIGPIGIACGAALLPSARGLARVLTLSAVAAYACASFAWAWSFNVDQRELLRPALAGLGKIGPHPIDWTEIPIDVHGHETPIRRFEPLMHLNQLYGIELGGIARYGHDSMKSAHHFLLRPQFAEPLPPVQEWFWAMRKQGQERKERVRRLLNYATAYGGVILYGTPDDVDTAKAAGFVPTWSSDKLFLGTFQGCPGKIELVGADAKLVIEAGWWPVKQPSQTLLFAPGGPTEVELAPLGCGDVWMQVRGANGEHCAGTGEVPLRAVFTGGGANVMTCKVERASPSSPSSPPSPSSPSPPSSLP